MMAKKQTNNIPDTKKNIDIVIISYAKSPAQKQLTENCISSLDDGQHNYYVYVMEQRKGVKYSKAVTINYDFEFNYNKCVNYCIENYCKSDFICFCNNDLQFEDGWATEILKYVPSVFLSSSPKCPKSHSDIVENISGTEVGRIIAGWCIFVHRSIFEKIGRIDDRVSFWYSDNVYGKQLELSGLKHVLVCSSIVTHIGSDTLYKTSRWKRRKLTNDQLTVYNRIKVDYSDPEKQELLVIPGVKGHRAPSGNIVLTEKFLSGMREYASRWPGTVTAMVELRDHPDNNLDHVEVKPGEQPFNVEASPAKQKEVARRMRQADLVLGGKLGISGVRQATVKEYGLVTRLQITSSESPNVLRKFKRLLFATAADIKWRHAARRLAGIQYNGVAAYNNYKWVNPNVMLFFDSRIEAGDLIDEDVLQQRIERQLSGAPLHLAFTGRLLKIKGVDHLPIIAAALRRRGVRFEMSVCGGGECEQQLYNMIKKNDLADQVSLRGVLRYREELLPFVRENIDLFVCTHTQGDPSCTYLETMACGVPIVGYANEAWRGMASLSQAGWVTPLKKPQVLAAKIAELDKDRAELARASRSAKAFAEQHLLENTMDRRVEHLLSCLKQPK